MQTSVIIPTHNRRSMIGRAIDSVLAQQGVDGIEIIVVDDGSTDGTAEFVRERYAGIVDHRHQTTDHRLKTEDGRLKTEDGRLPTPVEQGSTDQAADRNAGNQQPTTNNQEPGTRNQEQPPPPTHHFFLRLLQQPNRGAPAARNAGIRAATAKYIALLDSDDELTPNSLASRCRVLDANPAIDMVCGNFVHCVEGRQVGPTDYERLNVLGMTCNRAVDADAYVVEDFFNVHLVRSIALTSALCLRRATLQPDDFFNESLPIGQDWEFCLRFSRRHTVAVTMAVTARRHVHETNLVKTKRDGGGMILLDRMVLHYPDLTPDQRLFMRERLAEDLYEYAYGAFWQDGARGTVLKALGESMRTRMTWPKLKLLGVCCLPVRVRKRLKS